MARTAYLIPVEKQLFNFWNGNIRDLGRHFGLHLQIFLDEEKQPENQVLCLWLLMVRVGMLFEILKYDFKQVKIFLINF